MRKKRGMTIIETIFSLALAGILIQLSISAMHSKFIITEYRKNNMYLDAIDHAIIKYININKYLPLPADLTLEDDDVNFGVTKYTALRAGANRTANANCGFIGLVPVKSLALPEEYAYGPQNYKYLFVTTPMNYTKVYRNYFPIPQGTPTLTENDEIFIKGNFRSINTAIHHIKYAVIMNGQKITDPNNLIEDAKDAGKVYKKMLNGNTSVDNGLLKICYDPSTNTTNQISNKYLLDIDLKETDSLKEKDIAHRWKTRNQIESVNVEYYTN